MRYGRMPSIHTIGYSVFAGLFLLLCCGWASAESAGADVQLSVQPLDLARVPSNEDLVAAGQLGGPLHPTHSLLDARQASAMNASFGKAIQQWNEHRYKSAARLFKEHVAQFPKSPWVAEAVLHMGCYSYYLGLYSDAEDAFTWITGKLEGSNHPGAQAVLNKARLRLGLLRIAQYQFEEAQELFAQLRAQGHDWRHRTYASHWIQRISQYKADRLALLNCGRRALAHLLEKRGKGDEAKEVAATSPTSIRGDSMEALSTLAVRYGHELVAVQVPMEGLDGLPHPAIVYLGGPPRRTQGHYWILEGLRDGRLELLDSQGGQQFSQTFEQFRREWSGVALVFAEKGRLPGHRLSRAEMGCLFGGCCGVPRPQNQLGDTGKNRGPGGTGDGCGSPRWSVNMVNMNIHVADTPLWYESPIGPSVNVRVSYNSLSTLTYHEPFGNKWQFNYASYVVVDPSGTVSIFMPDGRVDQYTPKRSGGYKLPYQVFNRLTKVADNHFELTLPDDTVYVYRIPDGTTAMQPFLVEVRDAHGQKLTLGYNTNVQLTSITDAGGKVTTLVYNTEGLVTQVNDPFGRSAVFEYDANRSLTAITDMGGYRTELRYDVDINLAAIENERGKWHFYVEPADGIGNGSSAYPPPGGFMWEDYRITVTNPVKAKQEYYYDGFSGYSWYVSPNHYVPYESYSRNNSSTALKTAYRFTTVDGYGEISTKTRPEGDIVTYGYDTAGNRVSVRDANGYATTLVYNSLGCPTSVTNAKGLVTRFLYAANGVDLLEFHNGLGSLRLTYNTTHQPLSIQDRSGNPPWKFGYNAYGQPVTSTDPLDVRTQYVYNANHQLVQIKTDGKITDTFTYDIVGRVSSHTDATGLTRRYTYTDLDQLKRITFPDDKFVEYFYSGCCPRMLEKVTDRTGRSVLFEHDAAERLVRTVNAMGGATSFEYDASGNLTMVIDPNWNTTVYRYDGDDRVIQEIYANGQARHFAYDAKGLLLEKTNARGIATTYAYDEVDNLLAVSYSDGTPGVTHGYDDYNRMVRRSDGTGTSAFSYDKDSRLLTVKGPYDKDTLTYTYDKLGRRSSLAIVGGQTFSYLYDTLGRLETVQVGSQSYTYAYTGASPLVHNLTRPNGSSTIYTYDALKRLILVSHRNSSDSVLRQFAYGFDDQDLISSENRIDGNPKLTLSAEFTTYDYNELNQVIRSATPEKVFSYDDDGNMTRGYTPQSFPFSADYDAENRLKSLQYTDGAGAKVLLRYAYSGEGALKDVQKNQDNVQVSRSRFVNEGFVPIQERDGSDNLVRQYTWGLGLGGGIGGLLQLTQEGASYSYLFDGRGNVDSLLNSSQTVAAAYSYDGYGNPIAKTGSLNQPFLFSSKAYDESTGLSYFGYRFYALALGRWITRDPIGFGGGDINLYGYVQNNPVNAVDPFGLRDNAGQVKTDTGQLRRAWDRYFKILKQFHRIEELRTQLTYVFYRLLTPNDPPGALSIFPEGLSTVEELGGRIIDNYGNLNPPRDPEQFGYWIQQNMCRFNSQMPECQNQDQDCPTDRR